ncbi:MAG: FAD-dependent oxidoreductase [Lachnospiraceae bacterium]|nr:FAD-dependent oxidoreductase [Lachnospiraceae bacterium]
MLIVNQLKLKPGYTDKELVRKLTATLQILPEDLLSYDIERQSIDARRKPDIFFILSVVCNVRHEESVLRRLKGDSVSLYNPAEYKFTITGKNQIVKRPVIVGDGPCGLFAAYMLAKNGYKPLILERGFPIDMRKKDVERFWNGGPLNESSNVLFGEGGAGTFSDGKLNTLVKDKEGRNKEVLRTFVKFGADPSIMYEAKPHIGTDVLEKIVKAMRDEIEAKGGEFKFNAEMTDILISDDEVVGVMVNGITKIDCSDVLLCIGHSARNTFEMLYKKGIHMEQKDFAVGLRVEHSQKMIDKVMYSDDEEVLKKLPHAAYKLTYKADNGRGVYSFCMCPGGYVVNASSEKGLLCINGMSYSGRNGDNANSAIVVTVGRDDFGDDHPLSGIRFQRELERRAYEVGSGNIPAELYGDFKAEVFDRENLDESDYRTVTKVSPNCKGAYTMGKVSEVLPKEISKTLIEGMDYFGRIIPGFNDNSVIVSAVETRTSSPVRITRDENFQALNIKGLYPCGEGAGYAGGITSAAMDGMKAAEKIAALYKPFRREEL